MTWACISCSGPSRVELIGKHIHPPRAAAKLPRPLPSNTQSEFNTCAPLFVSPPGILQHNHYFHHGMLHACFETRGTPSRAGVPKDFLFPSIRNANPQSEIKAPRNATTNGSALEAHVPARRVFGKQQRHGRQGGSWSCSGPAPHQQYLAEGRRLEQGVDTRHKNYGAN